MSKRFQSTRWLKPVYIVLVLWGCGALYAAGLWTASPQVVKTPPRPHISAQASYATVKANFEGNPYVSGGISELPGFTCEGWSNKRDWVVIRCSR